jgi:hypothetical protein
MEAAMDGSRAHPAVMTVILALRAHGAITLACLERPMRPHNGRREPVLVVDWAVIRNVA